MLIGLLILLVPTVFFLATIPVSLPEKPTSHKIEEAGVSGKTIVCMDDYFCFPFLTVIVMELDACIP